MKQIPDEAKERAKRNSGKSEEHGKTNSLQIAIYRVANFQTKERKHPLCDTNDNLSSDVCNILVKKKNEFF